jgi:O-antigen ligase
MISQLSYNKPGSYLIAALMVVLFTFSLLHFPYPIVVASTMMLVSLGVMAVILNYSLIFKLLFVLLPLSLELSLGIGDSKIQFPSEPLIIVLAIAFTGRFLFNKNHSRIFLNHPLILAVFGFLSIMALSSVTSLLPAVSVKFTAVYTAYILVFCFLANDLLIREKNGALELFFLYALSISTVVIYSLFNLSSWHFVKDFAGLSVQPFYSDHAIYSACLSMLIPVFIAIVFNGKVLGFSGIKWYVSVLILFVLFTGSFFAYSRAAWVSLLAAAALYLMMRSRIRLSTFLLISLVVGAVLFFKWDSLVTEMKLNRNNSTRHNASLAEQTKSVTNIKSDVSNAERLNRWNCAYRMFLDKPLTGFGPGTYQFEYLSYQRYDEMTRISVTSPYNIVFGKGGTAHSEYMLALSESGIGGLIGFLCIAVISIITCFRIYYNTEDKRIQILIAVCMASLVTYYVHTIFNNYLNIDKTGSLFWLFISWIVALAFESRKLRSWQKV